MIGKNSMKHPFLDMEDIANVDCAHTKRACKVFEIKNIMIYLFKAIHYCQLMCLRTLEI